MLPETIALGYHMLCFGADPEIFLTEGGKIVGAETVLPGDGLGVECGNRVMSDGVQAELQPLPSVCRVALASNITACYKQLSQCFRAKRRREIAINFSKVIRMSRTDLNALSEKARILGCEPSFNVYTGGQSDLTINPARSLIRSAAGHIHLGLSRPTQNQKAWIDSMVRALDLIVGNTCVLIDRDPANVVRRKVYGRAGEFRLPPHGIEYRTLSNFWLHSYQLMSLVMGLVDVAVNVAHVEDVTVRDFLTTVNHRRVARAINTNNVALAQTNFDEYVRPILERVRVDRKGLCASRLPAFDYFVRKIGEEGLNFWFPFDPVTHWLHRPDPYRSGWESFMAGVVTPMMRGGSYPKEWWKKPITHYVL